MDTEDLLTVLEAVLPASTDMAVIHSSLAELAPRDGLDKWDTLRAIDALVRRGMTLAFPAFTFSFTSGQPFDLHRSPSETGLLADWVLELTEAVRTRHPIYSFAVIGPRQQELLAATDGTVFGDDSPFGVFEKHNARIVMLGCSWEYCTQFHRYEEIHRVPYRYFKEFIGQVNDGGIQRQAKASMYVRDLGLDPTNDFSAIVDQLRSQNRMLTQPLWRSQIESASAQDVARVATELLTRDKWAFVRNSRQLAYRLHKREQSAANQPIKVAVLGHANVRMLEDELRNCLQEFISDAEIQIYSVPYGQVEQQIIDDQSDLMRFDADFTFFIDRPEDLLAVNTLDALTAADLRDGGRLDRRVDSYEAMIRAYAASNEGVIVVNGFCSFMPSAFGQAEHDADEAAGSAIQRMQARLRDALVHQNQLHFFDLQLPAAEHDLSVLDPRLWFLGRFPFSASFTRVLAQRYTAMVLAATGRTSRLLVLDLDNTLWGGILGEDGIAGLQLGGDYPGNTFATFQRVLKRLAERGVALAVCSKNDESLAIEAMDSLPNMAIRAEDLAAWRINWRPKHENVKEIAAQLSLGLESILFIDDNPVEREQMRQQLPEVKVLDLPEDSACYAEALLRCPWLETLQLTREDFRRAAGYRARQQVNSLKDQFSDLTSFHASLNLTLQLQRFSNVNSERVLQLIGKTNQFNVTTRRHSRAQLERFIDAGDDVVAIGVEDRFNEMETMGVLITRWNQPRPRQAIIDTFLLSCRSLGKGVEEGVIFWLKLRAREHGMTELFGEVLTTDRNEPARGIFARTGFERLDDQRWRCDLTTATNEIPDWLTVHDRMEIELPS